MRTCPGSGCRSGRTSWWGPWQTRKMPPNAHFFFVLVAPNALADPSLVIPCASWFLMALQWLGPIALTLLDGHWDAQLGGLSLASVSMYHWFLVICRYLWKSRFMTLLQVTKYLFPLPFSTLNSLTARRCRRGPKRMWPCNSPMWHRPWLSAAPRCPTDGSGHVQFLPQSCARGGLQVEWCVLLCLRL